MSPTESVNHIEPSNRWKLDYSLSLGLFLLLFTILGLGLTDYGFTWDEAETNFPAARNQAKWLTGLAAGQTHLSEESIRTHFETESDHPSLPRTLMALSRAMLPDTVSDRFAFRLPIALLVSVFGATLFLWVKSYLSLSASLVVILFLSFHPRWFAHSHLGEYDILISMAWCASAITFIRIFSFSPDSSNKTVWWRTFIASCAFGLAMATKLHAFFIPFPFLVWVLIFRKWGAWRWALLSAVLAPLIYLATQPYLWWETVDRVRNRFVDYSEKVPISTYYLGEWFPGNVPWHYPWVLLFATLPVGFLVFALIGGGHWIGSIFGRKSIDSARRQRLTFYLLNAIATPMIFTWKSPYDGIRLFLTALPFLALVAGEGVEIAIGYLKARSGRPRSTLLVSIALCGVLLMEVLSCYRHHPYQLAYYSPLVGGVRGAHHIGLETTFWCDSISDPFIEKLALMFPDETRVGLHAVDLHPFTEYQMEGTLPSGWRFNQPGLPELHIIQFRQGFFGPLERKLLDSDLEIVAENDLLGVPLVRAYRRGN